jgi:response regulator RpfG family c-di-GMP phosphodiesterase
MRTIPISDLTPGQRFDKPVYVDGVNLLVPENVPIREKDIQRLKKWNIAEVTTEGKLLNQQGDEGPVSGFLQEAFNTPEQREVMKSYTGITERVREAHRQIQSDDEEPETDRIDNIVDAVFQLIDRRKNDLIQFILYGFQGEAGDVENAVNSTVLAFLVGQNLGMPKHRLLHLATAALLHDVGMLRLPESIVTKSGQLTPEEAKQIRTHPIHSYKIITREMRYPEEIGLAALQHQERWDGKGYPRAIAGKDITLLARIIAVVDSFEAMVSKRPYRSPMIGYTAMRNILSDNGRRFDPEIVKVFIRTLGIYPIGSIVLLSNSCIGRVVENNVNSPLKPKVRVMIDEHGREYRGNEGDLIDLYNDKKLFIAKAVDPKEVVASAT